ncbi:MAG: GNAT family N-acyltransferase [bacterium]
MIETVAPPSDPEQLRRELGSDTELTRFHDLEIHIFDGPDCPEVLNEIGRIREVEYRAAGAGRNLPRDLDRHDTGIPRYLQIVSFDREHGELVAMYRAMHCGRMLESHQLSAVSLRTAGLFDFSRAFVNGTLPHLVELGRSVVNRRAHRAVQGLFSVWSGLGALTRIWPDMTGYFGNVTVYPTMPSSAIRTLWTFLDTHYRAASGDVCARDRAVVKEMLDAADHADPECTATLEALTGCASRDGWQIPAILVSYLKACPRLEVFDIAFDEDFGRAFEIAIHVPVNGLTEKTRRRFIDRH